MIWSSGNAGMRSRTAPPPFPPSPLLSLPARHIPPLSDSIRHSHQGAFLPNRWQPALWFQVTGTYADGKRRPLAPPSSSTRLSLTPIPNRSQDPPSSHIPLQNYTPRLLNRKECHAMEHRPPPLPYLTPPSSANPPYNRTQEHRSIFTLQRCRSLTP